MQTRDAKTILNLGIAKLEQDPHDVPTLLEMGSLMLTLKRWDTATLQFRHALKAAPTSSMVRRTLCDAAGLLERSGQSSNARVLYLSLLAQYPGNDLIESAWESLGDSDDAKTLVEHHPANKAHYRVSAIISTYRSAAFIKECLDNLLAQSMAEDIEIVIVDAASPEHERDIVRQYLPRHGNITYMRTRDRIGVYTAWNLAIRHATGHYCISVSTNDQLRQDGCELLASTLDEHPDTTMVYGNTYLTRQPHETYENNSHYAVYRWPDYQYENHLKDGCCIGPHPMWRKDVHHRIGYFDERFVADGDQEFWMRIGSRYAIRHIEQFTGLQWITEESLSGNGDIAAMEVAAIQAIYRHRWSANSPASPTPRNKAGCAITDIGQPAGMNRDTITSDPDSSRQHPCISQKSIKIVHLCMHDHGGAGNAAYRLHNGQRSIGMDSTMLVFNKKSRDDSVKVLPVQYPGKLVKCLDAPTFSSPIWNQQVEKWLRLMSNYPDRPDGLEMFTDAGSSVVLDQIREIRDADIVNLHWVSGAMDFANAANALKNKTVVWTLHDMNAFTGGCHYAGACEKYKTVCAACPQLGSDQEYDLARQVWTRKMSAYQDLDIHVITPSRWLGRCARQSALFSDFPVDVIPYGFPLDTFRPHPKKQIRMASNLPENANIILFGADCLTNKRKGFVYLLEALNRFDPGNERETILLTFGSLSPGLKIPSKLPIFNTGSIADADQLALIYSAADLFVLPSLEDNLPNTVVEAMACGLPVVGFDIGGVPDMVTHRKTGYLAKPKDIDDLIQGIEWVLSACDEGVNFTQRCRLKAEKHYALDIQAKAYHALYHHRLKSQMALPS